MIFSDCFSHIIKLLSVKLIERGYLLGRFIRVSGGLCVNNGTRATVQLVFLNFDPSLHVYPIACFVSNIGFELTYQSVVCYIVGTASHNVSAYDECVLAKLQIPCDDTFEFNDLAVVFFSLFAEISIPYGVVLVSYFNYGSI